jgi:hypothetical protein
MNTHKANWHRLSVRTLVLFALLLQGLAQAQTIDSDGDGLSDDVEQRLLEQFAPRFMVDQTDCSRVPAEFARNVGVPTVAAENGTIYGQVFGARNSSDAEIHFYHLWKRDCGAHGHPLDAEHVSVFVRMDAGAWKAVYWFAAAHENTVCDVSQIARAATLDAEDRGAKVWISWGKHASFLSAELAYQGCGNDALGEMKALGISKVVNLGEIGQPMNGAVWIGSPNWSLASKMATTDFPADAIARLNELPQTEVARFNPGRHPAQGVISISSTTAGALGTSGKDTVDAVALATDSTEDALDKSYRHTSKALSTSARHVSAFVHLGK